MSLKVFGRPGRAVLSSWRSHSNLKSLNRSSIGKSPKFIDPMLSEATSGLKVAAGLSRSSTVM